MQIDYQKLMTSKSDEGLQEYLDKCSTYLPEAVEAAIIEMQKRGRAFSDEELTTFRQNSEVSRKRNEDFLRSGNKRIGNNWKKKISLVLFNCRIICGNIFCISKYFFTRRF